MKNRLIFFRCDSSFDIGTGHVMRCLTLANSLKNLGARCRFICREFEGNLIGYIKRMGYEVRVLPAISDSVKPTCDEGLPYYYSWLGCVWEDDAAQTINSIAEEMPDWLVVDHYAIDKSWEASVTPFCVNIFVIDDLADRAHQCEILLDQSPSRKKSEYKRLVPSDTRLLVGGDYALFRPEFDQARSASLRRRTTNSLERILISLGGVDKNNMSSAVLSALGRLGDAASLQVSVVLGPSAPHLDEVERLSKTLPFETSILSDVRNMSAVMTDHDLAIGAAGTTSLEFCVLGLPSILLILAENQISNAQALAHAGAVDICPSDLPLDSNLQASLEKFQCEETLRKYSRSASSAIRGGGVQLVVKEMMHE